MNIHFNIRRFIGLVLLLWVGLAQVTAQVYRVGDLFTAPDGSQGIVYWLNPDGSGGWVVALNDDAAGCPWGTEGDIPGLDNQNPGDNNRQQLLYDTAGYAHTAVIRAAQGAGNTATGAVDFDHGWYLPAPAQLSILYGQLPFIEAALVAAGGTTLTTDHYWCSAEVDAGSAWRVYGYYGHFNSAGKTGNARVRAVRSFTYAPTDEVTYAWSDGSSGSSVTVLPTGTATWLVTATSGSCEASDTATVTRCATVVPSLFDGLVAYYPFDDDDLTDHTGNGNDGNNYGSTSTTDRFCREGKARNFAGVDSPQYIDVPNSSSLQFTDAATVSLWFCMNGKRGMDGWGHSTETGNNHYLFAKLWDYYKNMRTRISVLNSGEFILASEITQSCAEDTLHGLQLGQWMQATIVYTTTYIETYVNGQLVAHTDASNSFSSTNNNPLRFGMMGDDWYPMNGKLDDIRIFNRALDASEVEQLYLLDIVPQDSLLVYLPLNGNVTDYSGNGFQPVLHGNVTPIAGHYGDDSTAYHFPGEADSWIEIPNDSRLNLCSSFTVSAWYNREVGWQHGNLVSKGRDIQYGWKLGTSGTNVNGSSGNDAIASSTPADGYWHLATSVYDASTSTLRYYLDGELEAEATGCGIPHATNYPVAIGRHRSYADDSSDPWPYPFKGDIDDIVIYNRPLSAEEVHALYAYSPHAVGCVQEEDCFEPNNITVNNITPTSVDLGWTGTGDSYIVQYRQLSYLLEEGFENGIPSSWTIIDADGDGYQWEHSSTYLGQVTGHDGSQGFATSASYVHYVGALTPDNWLISPTITLTTDNTLTFYITPQDESWPNEHWGVYISPTGGLNPQDFVLLHEETLAADGVNEWTERNLDLSDYSGQTVRIAFRHFNCSDWYFLDLDDVNIHDNVWETVSTNEPWLTLTDLLPETHYVFRIKTLCGNGVIESSWSEQGNFTTGFIDGLPCPGHETVTDHEGNVYNTVKIGNQCWTKENMRCTTSPRGHLSAGGSNNNLTTPYYYEYPSSSIPLAERGYLYNWAGTMDTTTEINGSFMGRRGICPEGWHVPSDQEFSELINYLGSVPAYQCGGSSENVAKALVSTNYWSTDVGDCSVGNNPGQNNATGFSAVPAGYFYNSQFFYEREYGSFWSSTSSNGSNAYWYSPHFDMAYIIRGSIYKEIGRSVRCLLGSIDEPSVSTAAVTDITSSTAICGGIVTSDGGSEINTRGVCWSTSPNPTLNDNYTNDGTGTGAFTSNITGLTPCTTYYVRAFARNYAGTRYGEEFSFTTEPITTTFDTVVCSSELPLTWNGYTFFGEGTHTFTLQNANGCDSSVTLHLIEGSTLTFEMHDSYGDGWNGNKILVHNHDTVQEVTLDNGTDGTVTIPVHNGTLEMEWLDGSWKEECSVTITGPCINYSTTSAPSGYFLNGNINCQGGTPAVPSFNYWMENTCNSVIVHFENTSTDADSASWNIAGYTSSEWNPAYEFTESGNYTVTLQAYNSSCELNWEQTQGFMVNVPAPITTTLDTAVCAPDLPLTWHGHTFSDYEAYTSVLQSATGCDSTVTLTVRVALYNLSDDFNDGIIDTTKWTFTGNAVLEENGQLKLQQNVTDQDVHLRSVDMQLPASGKVAMDRRFMVHRSSDSYYGKFYYGRNAILLNGDNDTFIGLEYLYTEYYDGTYHYDNPQSGIHLISKLNGVDLVVRLCDITFDTMLTEHIELDFAAGTLSYYMDTLVATVSIPELSNQTVNYYNVEFRPSGWWTGHQHYMDWVDIYEGTGGAVITSPVSNVAHTTATCGGDVSLNECDAYTAAGVCWSTEHFPTLADAHTSDGTGMGSFMSSLTNLTPGTTYYVRAYATNSVGTVYGNEVSFTTLASDTTYTTITIGNGESSDYNLPFNNFYKNSWSQMIYPASQINETGNITSIAFYVDAVPSMNYPFSTLNIYMGISEDSVNATNNSWLPMSELSEVYSTTDFASPIDTGWQTFNLSTPFPYDGSGHLVIVTSKTMPNYTNALRYRYTTGAANCCIYRRSDSSPEIYASHPGSATGTLSDRLPNLRFTIEVSGDFCYGVTDLAVNDISKTGAAISWSPSNSANVGYIMQYKTTDQNWDDATTIIVYDTTYDLAGMLTSSTIYNIRIATNCGWSTSAWRTTSFATLCDTIAAIPYMEGFDTYGTGESTFPLCWTKHTDYSSSSDYPYVSSSQHSGGTASLYFYKPSSNYMYAASQALNLANYSAGDLALNFNLRPDGLSNARIDVGIMSDPEDLATFTLLKSYYPSDFSANNQWHSFSIPFTQHYANPIHIAFYAPSSYSNTRMYVDEVKVDFVPVCSAPSNLTISDIAGTSAIVSWTGSQYGDGSYTVEYSDDGTVWSSLTTSETNVMLTGLTPTTTHQVRVYQNCNTNQSDTLTDSFTTHCLAGGDLQVGNGTETNQYLPSYNFYKYSLSEQLFTAEELGGANTFYSISFQCSSIVTPSREWTIYLMPTTATSLTGFVDIDSTAAKVFEGTVGIDTEWFTIPFDSAFAYDGTSNLILIVDDNTGSYVSANRYFVHTPSSGYSYFRYSDDTNYDPMSASTYSSSVTNYRNNVIFGGLCDSVVTCFAPNAHISGYDNQSIEVTWAPGNTEEAWELEYRAEGETEWSSVANPSSPMLISNLTSGISYDIRLRAVCSDYDYSDWVDLHGKTECDYITLLPYIEDFETSTGENQMVPCWTRGTNSSTQYPYTNSSQHHSGNYSLYFYGSSASYSYAATPRFDDSILMDSLAIHFHALKTSSSNYFVEVGIMTDPDDPSSFTLLNTFSPSQTNTFELGEVSTNDYSGNGHYVAFRCPQWVTNEIYLDDVVINYISNCTHVSNIHPISLDSISATIGWTPGGTEVSWNVYIVEGTTLVNVDTLTPAFVSDSTFQATNLLPNTIYTAYVQANCGYSQSYPVSGTFVTSQIPAQIPYFCDFEDESEQFSFENGNAANKWYIGTAANNGGSHALYISQDYGVSNTYNNSSSQVWAYRDIYFPESDDDYLLSFDWRCTGESHYDYMMVYLGAPAHIEPNSSAQPDGSMVLTNANNSYPQEFNLKDSYQHFSTVLSGQGTETVRRLYFYWHNDGYGCYNPAASVDNILIAPICTHSTEVVSACESYLWEDGNTYTVSGTYVYATIDTDGCANVDTLFLTINHAVTSTSSVTVCGDELPYAWNGITITEAGAYTTTLQAANGCDSTVTLTLNVVNGPSLTHTPDTLARADIPITLWANGASNLVWTDANGDTLGIGETLTVTPTEATTYYVIGSNSSSNLVVNGDFEQGNTGFTSEYIYPMNGQGYYGISDEIDSRWGWFADHTSGSGKYMVIDGALVANKVMWSETLPVQPHTVYNLTAWLMNLSENYAINESNKPRLQFNVNGTQVGDILKVLDHNDEWLPFSGYWNSGDDTTAVITIIDQNTLGGENDFAIDDIAFSPVACETTEAITVTLIPAGDALPCPGHETVTDYDGNTYNTVKIGEQCWMKENLRVTHYEDGTEIPSGIDTSSTIAYLYPPDYNYANVLTYGYLYNWTAVMRGMNSSTSNPSGVQGICPNGWHVPSDAEWTQLTEYVSSVPAYICGGNSNYIAKALASSSGWNSHTTDCSVGNNMIANNTTGFQALPAGLCDGNFLNLYSSDFGTGTYFGGATDCGENCVWFRYLSSLDKLVRRYDGIKSYGLSLRCVLGDGCLTSVTESSDTTCFGSYTWNDTVYTESGDYTQALTSAAGCDSIVTLHLTIYSAPSAPAVTSSATAVCSGSQVTFTATGDANTAYYLWYANGVEVPGENGATLTVLLDEVNNYLYAAKAVSNAGCVSEEATTAPEVTVTPGYTVEVSGNGNICEGGSTTLTATVNNVLAGDALNYQWYKVTDGVPSAIYGENASSCTISDLSAGSYYYYVVVSGASGCSAISAYMPVNVTSPSAADLYDTAFNAYEWNGVTYTESGSYTQTFTNAAGCDSTVTLHLTINPAPLVTLSTTYSTICEGGITTIYANVTQGGTDILYTWFRNDVPLYSWNSSSISVDEAGVYKVMVTFNNSSTMSDPLVITVNPVPQLELTATETTICVGGTTVLSAAISNNDAVNYYWTNNYYQGSTYTLTPSSAGTYFIHVTADQTTPGCVAIDSIAITVNEIPSTPIISIGSSSSVICDGGQISLTITNPLSGANYIWHKNGSVISNATQSTLTEQLFTEGGSVVQYAYTAIIELPYSGCSSLESSVALATVLPDPVASISVAGNTEICEGGTTTLVVNVNPPESNYTYRWYKDDVLIPGTIYSEYVVSEAARSTAYNFRVEVSSNPGCDVSATAPPITVMADPVVTATTSDAFSCVGGTATMSATIAGGVPAANSLNNYTYTWYLDGQPVGNGSTYTTSGNESPNNYNYHVDVLASDYGCNASSNSVSIAVVYDPTVSIVVASGYPQTVCDGGATAIKAISTGGYGDATYQWYKNGNILTGETNQILNIPALTYGTNDIYVVEVTQSGAGCANIASVNISTLVTVAPAYTATISGNGNVCEGGSVTLNATVNNVLYNDANYQWYKVTSGYPSIIDGATSSTYETSNLLLAGSYDYYVVVTSSIPGCGVTSPSVPANVVPDPTVTLQGNNSVCVGNSLSFNAFISGGVPGSEYTYSWGFAGDCSGSYETSTPYFTYDANCYDGSLSSHHYYFAVTISRNDNSGCNATSTFHTVDLYNNSTTSISESACGSYTWNGQTYTQSGDYTQTFTNAAGCDSVVTLHLTIHPIPSVSISGSSSIDYGQSATLTAYGANSYSWSTGDNTPIITVSPTSATTYTVTGMSQYGCTAMASITVTVNLVAPTVITNNVYNISANSAIGSGNVTATGGATVTARGVCWSTSHNPTLDDAHSNNSGGTGTFNSSISGLQPNTTYYVRAYATNSAGTAYGNEVSFTTTCNTVSVTISGPSSIDYGQSATLTANGASSYQWSTGETSGSITISPTANTTYTVTGTDQYGCTATASKAVTVNPVLPTVITDNVSNVSTNSATCGGNVTSSGGAYVSARGVCWSTSPNPTLNNTYTGNGGGTGTFTSYINGLSPNTTYYVRAYATNNVGTAYGQEFSFTTGCITSSNQFSMVVCDSYVWNGHTYTQSGDYTQIFTNAIGCDSTVTLHLTILHSVTTTYSATECGSYNWNGQTYTESGTYTQTLTAANGCDSTVTLHLTILPSDTVSVEVTECSRYEWNGVTYTESGDYTQTFTNADGCDSVVTLHLTIERCTDEILVYPNPTSDHLHILFPDAALFEDEQYVYLFLYDPAGHLVFKQRLDSQETVLSLPALNNGLYLLEINVNGNTMQTFKQVIIR